MKTNKTKSDWEKEFDKNVNYDEAELGCNWGMGELKDFIRQTRDEARQEGILEAERLLLKVQLKEKVLKTK